jgi:signal recognition particle GTPase
MLSNISNQKYIIALQGSGNSGKTTTLTELANIINADPRCQNPMTNMPSHGTDFWNVYDLVIQPNQIIKVGLATGGDTVAVVKERMKYFNSKNCNVIFIATKGWGLTVDEIYNIAQQSNSVLIPFACAKLSNISQHLPQKPNNIAQVMFDIVLN